MRTFVSIVILINTVINTRNFHVLGQACTCDLTASVCDPNCCCDPDCTEADKNSFTVCNNADTNKDDRVCLSENVVLFNNAKFNSEGTGSGLFCIYKDNFAERNFYTSVQSAATDTAFDSLAAKYRTTTFQPVMNADQVFTAKSKYKVGDKVYLVFESNVVGFLAMPRPLTNSLCNDNNPAGFLQNEEASCTRLISDLPSQCANDRSLSAAGYFANFKFAPSPAYLVNTVVQNRSASSSVPAPSVTPSFSMPTESLSMAAASPSLAGSPRATVALGGNVSSSNASVSISVQPSSVIVTPSPGPSTETVIRPSYISGDLVNITVEQPILCRTTVGLDIPCSFSNPVAPTYDFQQNVCRNVVLKASYAISYAEGTSLNVSAVTIAFTLGDVREGITSIKQKFSVAFGKNFSVSPFRRSGNPGYLRGQPLLAGTLVQNQQDNKEAIQLSSNSAQWLTIIRADIDGACSNSTQRTSIVFGKNIRSGCYISIKRIMTSGECVALQDTVYNTLLKDLPTHVAMFGNSAVTKVADWVKIINVKPTNTPSVLNGECQNIVLGAQIEVLHSKTGFLANPQQKIVGVRVKYEPSRAIAFQCTAPTCQPGSAALTLRIDVVHSVAFVDVSASLEAKQKSKPDFTAKAPHDFFFPFF